MTASSKDSFHLYFLPGWRLFDILRYYFKCRAALHRIQNRFKGRVVFPCKACLLQDLPIHFPFAQALLCKRGLHRLVILWADGLFDCVPIHLGADVVYRFIFLKGRRAAGQGERTQEKHRRDQAENVLKCLFTRCSSFTM